MTDIIVESGQDSTRVNAKLLAFYSNYWKTKQQKYLHQKKEDTFFFLV